MDDLLTGAALAERARMAVGLPLAAALHVRLLDDADPTAGVVLEVAGGIADNGAGGVHASVLGAVLELGAYLALLPQLRHDEHAVTNTVSTQLLGPARRGERVQVRGWADRRTGRLGFAGAVASGPSGTVARAQVTKSIVRFDGAGSGPAAAS